MASGRSVVVVSGCVDTGPAVAAAFARLGDRVALVGEGEGIEGVTAVALDGVEPEAVESAVDAAAQAVGPLEVLVTVPGPGRPKPIRRADASHFTDHLDSHLTVAYVAARRATVDMVELRRGRIVFVSAVSALVGAGWESATGTAMAGLIGLCRSLARELAPATITVNVVAAGAIETSHLREVRAGAKGGAMIDAVVARTPLRRLGAVEDVADAVEYLASPEAAYLTGVVLPVDGGLGMGFS